MINEINGQMNQILKEQVFAFLPMTHILISSPVKFHEPVLYGSRFMAIFANLFHSFHKLYEDTQGDYSAHPESRP